MPIPLQELLRDELGSLKAYTVPADPPPVKLDANESPWPLPEEARQRLARVTAELAFHRYPDARAERPRRALAERFGGDPDQYLLGSGSDELIALLATALSNPRSGSTKPVVVFPEPTFVMYGVTSKAHGWEVVRVSLDENWQLDLEAMREAADATPPNIIYYASPNNPTGNTFAPETLETLIKKLPQTLHVVDEAYAAFSEQSLSEWCSRFDNVAVMGTLSKIGLAAIRFGWIRMHPFLAAEVDKVRQPFNLNGLTQEIATLALTDLAPVLDEQVRAVVEERAKLFTGLDSFDELRPYPSAANFILVATSGDTGRLCEHLLEHGIAVRSFAGHGGRLHGLFRVTVGTPDENEKLLEAVKRFRF